MFLFNRNDKWDKISESLVRLEMQRQAEINYRRNLYRVLRNMELTMGVLQDQIVALTAKVQAENATIDTVVTLVANLKAQIATLTAEGTVDPTVMQALSDAIDQGAGKLTVVATST